MTYTFNQIKNALNQVTGWDLLQIDNEDEDEMNYVLVDPFGDYDGDPFCDLEDVVDYVSNNDDVEAYLCAAAEYLKYGEN